MLVSPTLDSTLDHCKAVHISKRKPVDSSPPESLTLLWLAPIRSSALFLLISAHACAKSDINSRWSLEAEAFGDFDEVKLMHIEDRTQAVRSIRLQIGTITVLRRLKAH